MEGLEDEEECCEMLSTERDTAIAHSHSYKLGLYAQQLYTQQPQLETQDEARKNSYTEGRGSLQAQTLAEELLAVDGFQDVVTVASPHYSG